jgi:hypothetical protein
VVIDLQSWIIFQQFRYFTSLSLLPTILDTLVHYSSCQFLGLFTCPMKQCKIGVECAVWMGVKGEGVWALMGSSETIIKGVSTSIWSKPCRLYLLVFWNTIEFMGEIHM